MRRRDPRAFVLVRGDLSPGQVLAQSVHAAMRLAVADPASADLPLVVLSASTDELFEQARARLELEGVLAIEWREPDDGHRLTAIAFVAVCPKATSSLPLALREAPRRPLSLSRACR